MKFLPIPVQNTDPKLNAPSQPEEHSSSKLERSGSLLPSQVLIPLLRGLRKLHTVTPLKSDTSGLMLCTLPLLLSPLTPSFSSCLDSLVI